jgi:hypothetical protein
MLPWHAPRWPWQREKTKEKAALSLSPARARRGDAREPRRHSAAADGENASRIVHGKPQKNNPLSEHGSRTGNHFQQKTAAATERTPTGWRTENHFQSLRTHASCAVAPMEDRTATRLARNLATPSCTRAEKHCSDCEAAGLPGGAGMENFLHCELNRRIIMRDALRKLHFTLVDVCRLPLCCRHHRQALTGMAPAV